MRQLTMPVLGLAKETQRADMDLVSKRKDMLDACRLCAQLSDLSYEAIADRIGMDKGNFTRFLQGACNIPLRKLPGFMAVCGNFAPLQWLADYCGFELVDKRSRDRIKDLERQLEALKRAG